MGLHKFGKLPKERHMETDFVPAMGSGAEVICHPRSPSARDRGTLDSIETRAARQIPKQVMELTSEASPGRFVGKN